MTTVRESDLRYASILVALTALTAAPSIAQGPEPLPGVYSNEEQVYFAKEGARPAPPLVMLEYGDDLRMWPVTAFGFRADFNPVGIVMTGGGERMTGTMPDGTQLELRRARPVTCWVAVKKDAPKADGSPDWYFQQGVKLHDQGGRAMVGGGETGAQPLVIRMRNVIWPTKADGTPSTNKPSVVLYVHKPDKPDSAESYVWADPGAARIGINLRWMQASCGIDGMEQP
jgi:hypothetical protein